jgi:hypothetical protein
MKSDKSQQVPIMVNSESAINFGNNAYGKPATALNILRETILGRKLFDYAFREYSRRWAFKHPNPADFFRTMEDASGTDLDWFWRAWFYTTNHVDISLKQVKHWELANPDPVVAKAKDRERAKPPVTLSSIRNKEDIPQSLVEANPDLKDFYNSYDPHAVTDQDKERYRKLVEGLSPEEKKILEQGLHAYQLDFENLGGVVMPLIIRMEFENGKDSVMRIPAEIWRTNDKECSKVVLVDYAVKQFTLDPYLETADVNLDNNSFPSASKPSRFQLFKERSGAGARFGGPQGPNPMQQERDRQKKG